MKEGMRRNESCGEWRGEEREEKRRGGKKEVNE
jgi:hypothetical protein